MSRIGRKPITLPAGVEVKIEEGKVSVKGPKGQLTGELPRGITVEQTGNGLTVHRQVDSHQSRALHGLARTLINNMVIGVTEGYSRTLELVGVGYRAAKQGKNLVLNIGFSHPVVLEPEGTIEIEVPKNNQIIVKGIDKQQVGNFAAKIRHIHPPEPYKGKGIRYEGERVRHKVGKTGK
ncbi:MAG TPA: 50S ribosomal protein L6 [Firmicutes bacterium]|nr:50S ribosomal protein L6 [Bacillota bacterium]